MLVILGFSMITAFMYLILTKRVTPVAALIVVPTIFGLFAGAGLGLSDMIMEALLKLAPTAALLFFAITFFGIMIDVGLFDPLIRVILRFVKNDPMRLVVGTAMLTSIVSLDGDGSTTFIIVTSALLPIYLRLRMSPVVLTVVAATANGVLNTVPWGGSTSRAAAALNVSPIDIFVPMIPAIVAGVVAVHVLAYFLGRRERKRVGRLAVGSGGAEQAETEPISVASEQLATVGHTISATPTDHAKDGPRNHIHEPGASASDFADLPPEAAGHLHRPHARPKLVWVNFALTAAVMTLLVWGIVEPPVVLMAGVAIALIINFPRVIEQAEQLKAHAASVVSVVAMVFAASMLTGVLNGTGMVDAMAAWLVEIIPAGFGPHLTVVAGVLSLPLTFFMSNDAFYFGVLPVLTEAASHYGISAEEMARASIVGQPLHTSSPLVASFLLLVGLAKVELGDHHRKAIWRACVVGIVMLAVGALSAYPI
ncbi:CitMHS family transporter [Mycolicibacterium mageritense]|uniref:Citrate:proton symporter n=1 Tax=Mycolicibacterium mageritense TaxID=53462 RepID=A0ABM7HQN7_MYCME|nr:SLC13 family permease [Mycolicibacterium mageritense]MCC9183552.1 citrate:proton symporter [Mycolicibacterium mageritense]BBX32856.1 citrate:proton symporter [Mycolicibacterium mageritense]CDO22608.1 Citrate transporter [Mycolicibacterium mageritense DSM 44476 = CIP 104973]